MTSPTPSERGAIDLISTSIDFGVLQVCIAFPTLSKCSSGWWSAGNIHGMTLRAESTIQIREIAEALNTAAAELDGGPA